MQVHRRVIGDEDAHAAVSAAAPVSSGSTRSRGSRSGAAACRRSRTDHDQFSGCSTARPRTSARCASSTPSTPTVPCRRRRAVVHDAVRPRLAAHVVDGAARRPRPRARARCRRWRASRATRSNAATEEEPGRILHEMRFGESAGARARRRRRLLRHRRRDAAVRDAARRAAPVGPNRATRSTSCCPHADRALEWIDDFGDRDGDGYVEYQRANRPRPGEPGLEGLLGRDPLRRRHARRRPDRAVRGAGLRVRRARRTRRTSRPRPATTPTVERCRDQAAASSSGVQRRLLARRTSGYFALGLDARQAADRRARRPTWATACGPASSTTTRRARSRERLLSAGDVHRLGRAHAGHHDGRATTRSATTTARCGRTTTRSAPPA